MSASRGDLQVQAWLRERADHGSRPGRSILEAVMAEVDVAPQRPARPWMRLGRDLPMTRVTPELRRVAIVLGVLAALISLAVVVALLASRRHAPNPLGSAWATATEVTWAPDASHLAFLLDDVAAPPGVAAPGVSPSAEGGPVERLYVVAADGSGLRELSSGIPASNWAPVWSPDGRYVFLQQEVDAPGTPNGQGPVHLLAVAADGATPPVDVGAMWQEAWAPGGHAFAAIDEAGTLVVGAATSARTERIATQASMPRWSPDGAWILYQHGDPNGTDPTVPWLIRADGSDAHAVDSCPDGSVEWSKASGDLLCRTPDDTRAFLVDGTAVPDDPSAGLPFGELSPDGRSVLVWQEAERRGIRLVAADGTSTQLTDGDGDGYPTWSPDGAWVGFWGHRADGVGLYAVASSGTRPAVLVGPNAQWPPAPVTSGPPPVAWAPQGAPRLAFVRDHSIAVAPVDGSDPVTVLADDQVAATRGAAPTPPGDLTITIDDDGPDRAVYQAVIGPDLVFAFRNESNETWTVDFFDDGGGTHACPEGSIGGPLVATVDATPDVLAPPLDEVPVTCDLRPHSTTSITDQGLVPTGAFRVVLRNGALSRPIWVDFVASP